MSSKPERSPLHRWTPNSERHPDDVRGMQFALFYRNGPMSWQRHGSAPDLLVARRSAERIGGEVKAVWLRGERKGEVARVWFEGVAQ